MSRVYQMDPEMFKILILLSEMGGIHFLIVQKSRNGSLLIHSTGKLLSMLERGKTFFHDIIRANLHCIKDATYSGAYPFTFRQPIKHKIAFKSTILYPFIP